MHDFEKCSDSAAAATNDSTRTSAVNKAHRAGRSSRCTANSRQLTVPETRHKSETFATESATYSTTERNRRRRRIKRYSSLRLEIDRGISRCCGRKEAKLSSKVGDMSARAKQKKAMEPEYSLISVTSKIPTTSKELRRELGLQV